MEGVSTLARIRAWLRDHLLPGPDPVAERDAQLWEQHKDLLPDESGTGMGNMFGVPGGGF